MYTKYHFNQKYSFLKKKRRKQSYIGFPIDHKFYTGCIGNLKQDKENPCMQRELNVNVQN